MPSPNKSLSIKFDNNREVFHAGQELSGTIKLQVSGSPIKITCVKLHLLGRSKVSWVGVVTIESIVTYRSKEVHLDTHLLLSEDEKELPVGDHEFPFSFLLPEDLPTSFEGKHGHIRYSATAELQARKQRKQYARTLFTVIGTHDLNVDPDIRRASQVDAQTTLGCCCNTKPISASLVLPVNAAVPGQTLTPTVRLDNSSAKPVVVHLLLMQLVVYRTSMNLLKKKLQVAEKQLSTVPSFSSETLTAEIQIPSLPPSKLGKCTNIEIQYTLKLRMVSPKKLKIKLPMVIGTIPLCQQNSILPPSQLADQPQNSALPSTQSAPLQYVEAVTEAGKVKAKDRNDLGEKTFTPRYAVYSTDVDRSSNY